MEKKQGSVNEVDFCSLPEIRAAVLLRDGRSDELSEEELQAITHLFDLPVDKESVMLLEDAFGYGRETFQETGATIEEWEEDGIHFLRSIRQVRAIQLSRELFPRPVTAFRKLHRTTL